MNDFKFELINTFMHHKLSKYIFESFVFILIFLKRFKFESINTHIYKFLKALFLFFTIQDYSFLCLILFFLYSWNIKTVKKGYTNVFKISCTVLNMNLIYYFDVFSKILWLMLYEIYFYWFKIKHRKQCLKIVSKAGPKQRYQESLCWISSVPIV